MIVPVGLEPPDRTAESVSGDVEVERRRRGGSVGVGVGSGQGAVVPPLSDVMRRPWGV